MPHPLDGAPLITRPRLVLGRLAMLPTGMPSRDPGPSAPIRGRVVHAESAVPVLGAAITLVGSTGRTATPALTGPRSP